MRIKSWANCERKAARIYGNAYHNPSDDWRGTEAQNRGAVSLDGFGRLEIGALVAVGMDLVEDEKTDAEAEDGAAVVRGGDWVLDVACERSQLVALDSLLCVLLVIRTEAIKKRLTWIVVRITWRLT